MINKSVEFLDKICEISANNEENLIYEILGDRQNPEGHFFVRLDTFIDFKINSVKLIGVNHIGIDNNIASFSIGTFSESGTKIAEIDLKEIENFNNLEMVIFK